MQTAVQLLNTRAVGGYCEGSGGGGCLPTCMAQYADSCHSIDFSCVYNTPGQVLETWTLYNYRNRPKNLDHCEVGIDDHSLVHTN